MQTDLHLSTLTVMVRRWKVTAWAPYPGSTHTESLAVVCIECLLLLLINHIGFMWKLDPMSPIRQSWTVDLSSDDLLTLITIFCRGSSANASHKIPVFERGKGEEERLLASWLRNFVSGSQEMRYCSLLVFLLEMFACRADCVSSRGGWHSTTFCGFMWEQTHYVKMGIHYTDTDCF